MTIPNLPKLILAASLLLQGCSVMKESKFISADPEGLNEWQIEGTVKLDNNNETATYFRYTNVDGDYKLTLNIDDPMGEPQAVLSGNIEGGEKPTLTAKGGEIEEIAMSIRNSIPMEHFSYWMRELPATDDAVLTQSETGRISNIQESGWDLQYEDHMEVGSYVLPEQLVMEKGEFHAELELVRAEIGYLTSPCPGTSGTRSGVSSIEEPNVNNVKILVPNDGSAPLPRRIKKTDFCNQLFKVHGKIPNQRIGLYGPDSMMWKLSSKLAPGGMGAGRALLLQTAHPWITAAIDEHSIVRYDPLERARRTFVNVFTLVFGSMPQVMASAHKMHKTHAEIEGKMTHHAGAFEKGSEYMANEINSMIWVHSTLWETLMVMYEEVEGPVSAVDKEQYYQETKLFAMIFGIPEEALPQSWDEFSAYNKAMWNSPQLTVTENARTLRDDLFNPPNWLMTFPLWIQEMVTVAHMPAKLREGYEMEYGLWEKFNNAWLMAGAKFGSWILPDYFGVSPLRHEADARLEGTRVSAYHRGLIKTLLGTERLVN